MSDLLQNESNIDDTSIYLFNKGQTLFHFKGGIYKVLGIVTLTSSKYGIDDICVRYTKIADSNGSFINDRTEFVRPISEFDDIVKGEDYDLNFKECKRFSDEPQ